MHVCIGDGQYSSNRWSLRGPLSPSIEKEKLKQNMMKTGVRLGDERRFTNQKARPDGHRRRMT